MSDERRWGVDMRPFAGDEVNAAWAEVNRLRSRLAEVEQERDRLRSECAVCEKCGHVQAEPNWCHECGHRTTAPGWAKPLLDAFFERNDLAERAERAEAALRLIASCKSHYPGDCVDIAQKAIANVPSSLDARVDAPKEQS